MKRLVIIFMGFLLLSSAACAKKSEQQAGKVSSFVKKESVQKLSSEREALPVKLTNIEKYYDEAAGADLVTITLNNAFVVGNIKVVKDGAGNEHVVWPGYKSKSGRFYPTLKFISQVLKKQMEEAIIKGEAPSTAGETLPFEITDVYVRPYERGKLKGFVTLTINDKIKIGNIKIMEGKKGLWVAMPSEKKEDGNYVKYAYPIRKGLGKEITQKVLEKYNKIVASKGE